MNAAEQNPPAGQPAPTAPGPTIDPGADRVYRKLLKQYIKIYDAGSWSLTLGAMAVVGFIMTNLDKVKTLAGPGNTYITVIAVGTIAVIGLLLKTVHSKISAIIRFRVPEICGREEQKALQAFDRCFWLLGETLIEKLHPGRTVAARRRTEPKDVHERWGIWLRFVRLSVFLSQLRNLAVVVTVASFVWGAIAVAKGHDRSLAELKKEMNIRVVEMDAATKRLESDYQREKDLWQENVAAYRKEVANEKELTASTQKMLENRDHVVVLQRNRIQVLDDTLRRILIFQKSILEREGTPKSMALDKTLNEAIKSLDSDPLKSLGGFHESAEKQTK